MQKGTSRSPGTSCNQVKDADCRLVPLDEDLARAVPFIGWHVFFYVYVLHKNKLLFYTDEAPPALYSDGVTP